MSGVKQLKLQIEESESLKLVSAALGEIAAMKLRTRRDQVQKNFSYFSEISRVYHAVKIMATKSSQNIGGRKNGQTISIALTSNYRLYGGLDTELIRYFMVNTVKYKTERLVIGSVGKDLLVGARYSHSYDTLAFKDDTPSTAELSLLISKIISFSRILFFHSKMLTLLDQQPTVTDISPEENLTNTSQIPRISYILEPEIDKILNFFENQILGALINSIFLEAEISRTAARMISMDQAEDNAVEVIRKQKKELVRAKRALINRRILETYSSRLKRRVL